MHELIQELGLGLHKGPFTLTANGKTPNWRGNDWPGEAGETVVAEAIKIDFWHTKVFVNGVGYNSVCFD